MDLSKYGGESPRSGGSGLLWLIILALIFFVVWGLATLVSDPQETPIVVPERLTAPVKEEAGPERHEPPTSKPRERIIRTPPRTEEEPPVTPQSPVLGTAATSPAYPLEQRAIDLNAPGVAPYREEELFTIAADGHGGLHWAWDAWIDGLRQLRISSVTAADEAREVYIADEYTSRSVERLKKLANVRGDVAMLAMFRLGEDAYARLLRWPSEATWGDDYVASTAFELPSRTRHLAAAMADDGAVLVAWDEGAVVHVSRCELRGDCVALPPISRNVTAVRGLRVIFHDGVPMVVMQATSRGMVGVLAAHYDTVAADWNAEVLAAPTDVRPPAWDEPRLSVASGASGVAVAWLAMGTNGHSIRARRWSAEHGWVPAQQISREDALLPVFSLGMDGLGNVTALWESRSAGRSTLYTRRYSAAKDAWEEAQVLGLDRPGKVIGPALAVTPHGEALAVWRASWREPGEPGPNQLLRASRYIPDEGWQPPADLPGLKHGWYWPLTTGDQLALAWLELNPDSSARVRRSSSGQLVGPRRLQDCLGGDCVDEIQPLTGRLRLVRIGGQTDVPASSD